jgi:hypothetical protein
MHNASTTPATPTENKFDSPKLRKVVGCALAAAGTGVRFFVYTPSIYRFNRSVDQRTLAARKTHIQPATPTPTQTYLHTLYRENARTHGEGSHVFARRVELKYLGDCWTCRKGRVQIRSGPPRQDPRHFLAQVVNVEGESEQALTV